MILRKVWVQDLFSYRGKVELDLTKPRVDHPGAVVLVHGRNGQGKTSLLNSLKLLFGGVTERMRGDAVQGVMLKQNEYLTGRRPQWWGVLHRGARDPGQTYGVGAEWDSADGAVRLERRWQMGNNGEPEDALGALTWQTLSDHTVVSGDEARRRLERVFPPFVLPLFLFDGEQIMALAADHSADRVEQVKRLLNLTPLEALQERVVIARRGARREALDGVGRAELEQAELALAQLRAQLQRVAERQRHQAREVKELDERVAGLNAALAPYRVRTVNEDRAKLQGQLEELITKARKDARALAVELPVQAPWLFNPTLLTRAARALGEQASGVEHEARAESLSRVKERLDRELFAVAPSYAAPLNHKQIQFYKDRLRQLIDLDAPQPDPDHLQLSTAERQLAIRRLDELAGAEVVRARWLKTIRQFNEGRVRLQALHERVEELAVEREDERKRREGLQKEREELVELHAKARVELERLNQEQRELQGKEAAMVGEVEAKERQAATTDAAARRADLAERVEGLLKGLVPLAFRRQKDELEERVNEHLRALLTSNALIDRVVFSERLEHQFRDAAGREIGTASVSAGMKQLYAMAFLWALKDA
jgi:DNA sulfur modification protein DndD